MSDWTLRLPWPPSKNGYWRTFRNRQILSVKARAYRVLAREAVESQLGADTALKLSGRLKVRLEFYPPTRCKWDVDGRPGGLLDALTHTGVWGDDSQIDDLRLIRRECLGKPGHVMLTMREL